MISSSISAQAYLLQLGAYTLKGASSSFFGFLNELKIGLARSYLDVTLSEGLKTSRLFKMTRNSISTGLVNFYSKC